MSLLSLNAVDYPGLGSLVTNVFEGQPRYLRVSIPSTRVESFNVDLARALRRGGRRGGSLTFAPEAATPRLRGVINKPVSDAALLEACETAFSHGFRTIKLYFMIGQPTETLDDVQAIGRLAGRLI